MIRIRQIALVARDLEEAVRDLSAALDVDVIYRDPGVAHFGLHNALFCIGDQFLEIVSPIADNTTAGRLLHKRGGDGGYMAIYDTDNVDELVAHAKQRGVRFVWEGSVPGIRGHHMHPRDTSGTLVSIDETDIPGEWPWAGKNWATRRASSVASEILGFEVAVEDPDAARARWEELGINHGVHFTGAGARGEGLDVVILRTVDPARHGEEFRVVGTTFRLLHHP
jgi:catechol 2,3-dioxygenase-like lactoylglutathione lyase family enzyme